MENNQNGRGLDEGYFEENYQPMFEQPQPANQWDMSDVPPIDKQPQPDAQEKPDDQENQANQGNEEKRPAAKKVITIALVIAMSVGIAVSTPKVVKKVQEHDKKVMEQIDNVVQQTNHDKEILMNNY